MAYEVVIIGAGGAGLMCAAQAARRGRRVLVIDHAQKIGGKILISGGGRCNFTNLGAGPANYVSKNPDFCKSALARYPSSKFVELVRKHGIAFHEKKLGQLFCDVSAKSIVELLQTECAEAGAQVALGTKVEKIEKTPKGFFVDTTGGSVECQSLVIASGGLSIPKIGATGFGYDVAKQFGLRIVAREPALDGFVFGDFGDKGTQPLKALSGVSIDVVIEAGGVSFRENILFTHAGLSGPASLQASLHWQRGKPVTIDLVPELPGEALLGWFMARKKDGSRGLIKNVLSAILPSRFAELFCELHLPADQAGLPLPQVSDAALKAFCELLHAWKFVPSATVGYGKAEVTRGGVDTDELSSQTMEARRVPGLYFIGEVVDVTGWLGGYNFQWAWASGVAAGQVV
jgi:predicted Rossmann fold flavoprotein